MCGLAALVDCAGAGAARWIGAMTAAVSHRGPDDEGYALIAGSGDVSACAGRDTPTPVRAGGFAYSPRGDLSATPAAGTIAALGHRRLSIVDLTPAGHQPMASSDRRLWIVYNGEIYNHVELRAGLEREGATFVSTSDTEVILAAWRHWGPDCLARFNGMFAFVLVDLDARVLHAVRDRFGVKPLYWWRSPDGLIAFASEIKQFTVLPGWRPRVNGQRAYDYLAWSLFDHTDETLFEGVRQLRGGERVAVPLDVQPARIEPQRWYALAPLPFSGTAEDAAETFRARFTDAVGLRLRADVPVGSCLSGGLDSSSIVCVANRLLRARNAHGAHRTFSSASDVARFDERRHAEDVIAATGVEGHFVVPDADGLFTALDALVWHQDEPFGSSSIYAQWCVFRLAAGNGVKVMLDGQGADELLAGYTGFIGPQLSGLLCSFRWLVLAREFAAYVRSPSHGARLALAQLANSVLPEAPRQRLRRALGRSATAPPWLDLARLGAQDIDPFARDGARPRDIASLSRQLLLHTGVPMLLHTEDRNSMAHSVEARVPFLDYRLVEAVLGMPDDRKLSDAMTKRVLREAMRGILPEGVRTRTDKLGFATAEETWVRETATARFRAGLADAIEVTGGVLRPGAMDTFDAIVSGSKPFGFLPWRWLSFGAWARRFGVAMG